MFSTLLTAGSAAAAPGSPDILAVTPVPASGQVSCYGYFGTFKAGTDVVVIGWDSSSNECFGIATDRTIWHTWPNSGGWRRMGGNGHADEIAWPWFTEDPATGWRQAAVYAASNDSIWCQDYYPTSDWTGIWYRCDQ